jgi:hypothetical protein
MNASTVTDEPGSTDDRLTLSVANHPEIEDSKDGNSYRISGVFTQQATGEYSLDELTSFEPAEATAEEPSEPSGEGEASAGNDSGAAFEEKAKTGYRNPAVDRMMQ